MKETKRPVFLKKGDIIDLVAPSFGCTTEPYLTRLEIAKKQFQKRGFIVRDGPNIYKEEGAAASATPKERADELMEAFKSDSSLVLSVGGGETMCEMLPFLDFSYLKTLKPKWFMGFSDNTNLTLPLLTLLGWESVYGPCASSFFQKKWRLSELDAYRMLSGERHFEGYPKWSISRRNINNPLRSFTLSQPKIIIPHNWKNGESVEGVLIGGCLDCIITLMGTRFDKCVEFIKNQKQGVIWYIEACDLNVLSLRRAYFEMKEADYFLNTKAIIIGRPLLAREEIMGIDRFKAATDILGELNIPILMDIDLGHLSPSLPIRNGTLASVCYKQGNIFIDYLN